MTSKRTKPAKFKTKQVFLTNHTHYQTVDLCKFLDLIFVKYKRTAFGYKFDDVRVVCEYRRLKDGFCGGYAYYNNNLVIIKLPKIKVGYGGETFEQNIARTFLHELDHCSGKKHGEMMNDNLRDISFIPADLLIGERVKPKKKVPDDADKIISLMDRKKKWETKIKRSETALAKINKTLKYYERKAAAKNKKS